MSGFTSRENEIFETIQAFLDDGLEFVVVGGYAVSAYQHRFSVDADLVIRDEDVDAFRTTLQDRGFDSVADKELDVYQGRYLAYEKDRELPVTIDLLVNSLQCRQTDAAWSYEYLHRYASRRPIEGTEKQVKCFVPEPALLIAIKLHSGRKTDARDVVALVEHSNLEDVPEHSDRGDPEKRQERFEGVLETIKDPSFEDSFKGVFSHSELPEDPISSVERFIEQRVGSRSP